MNTKLIMASLAAADRRLKARGYVAFDEVFLEMGKLEARDWEAWRFGRVPYLERAIRLNLGQIAAVCRAVQSSARRGNLKPSWTAYNRWGKGARTLLRFTKSGDPSLERIWATRHVLARPRDARGAGSSPSGVADSGTVGLTSAVIPETDSRIGPMAP